MGGDVGREWGGSAGWAVEGAVEGAVERLWRGAWSGAKLPFLWRGCGGAVEREWSEKWSGEVERASPAAAVMLPAVGFGGGEAAGLLPLPGLPLPGLQLPCLPQSGGVQMAPSPMPPARKPSKAKTPAAETSKATKAGKLISLLLEKQVAGEPINRAAVAVRASTQTRTNPGRRASPYVAEPAPRLPQATRCRSGFGGVQTGRAGHTRASRRRYLRCAE